MTVFGLTANNPSLEPGSHATIGVYCDGARVYRRHVRDGAAALGEDITELLGVEAAAALLEEHATLERIETVGVTIGPRLSVEERAPSATRYGGQRRSLRR